MPRYLVAIYRPNGYDPAVEDDAAMRHEIDTLNDEMRAAGVVVFVGGLRPPSDATSVRRLSAAAVEARTGPCSKAEEHVGGLWVLDTATQEEALRWGRRAAVACRASVEVRPFH